VGYAALALAIAIANKKKDTNLRETISIIIRIIKMQV